MLFLLQGFVQAQNLEKLLIEKVTNSQIVIPQECNPGNIIIVINSTIRDLTFGSNMLLNKDFIVVKDTIANQYVICHEKMRFKLTISGPKYYEETLEIFNVNEKYSFNIKSKTLKGTINIRTKPGGAKVTFKDLKDMSAFSGKPITMVADNYKINISKRGYVDIDTTVLVPSNDTRDYNFDLKQDYAALALDLKTSDNVKFTEAPLLWIDSIAIGMESMVSQNAQAGDFNQDINFYQLYEGGIIPIRDPGDHKIKINAEGFQPYEKILYFEKGKSTPLAVRLEPLFGFLSIRDVKNAEGATVLVDNKEVGQIPLFEAKVRIGPHEIKVKKDGFMADKEAIPVLIKKNENTIADVSMEIFKRVTFTSTPSRADVILNGSLIGFTETAANLSAKTHTILVKKSSYATFKKDLVIDEKIKTPDTIHFDLKKNQSLLLNSELKNLKVSLVGLDSLEQLYLDSDIISGNTVLIPFGRYKAKIMDGDRLVYKGAFVHDQYTKGKALFPCYSKFSFRLLTADMINLTNFEASFGQSVLFKGSGLSTQIASVQFLELPSNIKVIIPSIFLMNWDFRTGGSVTRYIDVSALVRAKYSPGLKLLSVGVDGYYSASVFSYFYGMEISTRLPYVNLNCKVGMQNFTGDMSKYDGATKKYLAGTTSLDLKRPVISLGVTINGPVYKTNNMVRIWHTPVFGIRAPYMTGPGTVVKLLSGLKKK